MLRHLFHPILTKTNTGKVSEGIDTKLEFVTNNQQSQKEYARESPIGLGFRVPMVIASPWTRGGFVCSEVFDHTSSLLFLEKFLEKKSGKKIKEPNINEWRRTVCGDLHSAFRPYNGEKISLPKFLEKEKFIEKIYDAKFKQLPDNYKKLSKTEIAEINQKGHLSSLMPSQEKGIRSSCPLPYELYVNGNLDKDGNKLEISFKAGNTLLAMMLPVLLFMYMLLILTNNRNGAPGTMPCVQVLKRKMNGNWPIL